MPICNNPLPQVQEPAAPGERGPGRAALAPLPEGPCPSGPPCQDPRGPGPAVSLGATLRAAESRLAAAGVDSPRLDAQILIASALGTDRTGLLLGADRPLSRAEQQRIARKIARRAAHEPVGRILGVREFWSLPFRLAPATLEPRPDSETLIETVLDHLTAAGRRADPLRLLDLGTGTGCLLLALLHELPASSGLGVDIAPGAVRCARRNAAALGLAGRAQFRCGDLRSFRPRPADAAPFDVVIANPPYIPAGDIPALAPELAFDPPRALDGGADGLDFYRAILHRADSLLAPGGLLVLEIGQDQAPPVIALGHGTGLDCTERRQDLGGRDRVLVFGRI